MYSIKKEIGFTLFPIAILLFFIGCSEDNNTIIKDNIVGTKLDFGKKEPLFPPLETEFKFKSVDGKEFKVKTGNRKMVISGLENKIVFLKIFGWDCQYCKKEIPELIALKKDLADSFEIIAIEAEKYSTEESLEYIKKYGINYNIINGNSEKQFYDYLKMHYGWSGIIPLTIVLGKHGKILAYEVGAKSYTLSELMKASLARDKNSK